jgi:hypothetical protein
MSDSRFKEIIMSRRQFNKRNLIRIGLYYGVTFVVTFILTKVTLFNTSESTPYALLAATAAAHYAMVVVLPDYTSGPKRDTLGVFVIRNTTVFFLLFGMILYSFWAMRANGNISPEEASLAPVASGLILALYVTGSLYSDQPASPDESPSL